MIPRTAGPVNPVDLRKLQRHPLVLELSFSYQSEGVTYIGTGRTRNLGGETISFETDQEFRKKGDVELRILWPFRLQGVCQLELVIKGVVVRTDSNLVVLRMGSCEFKTLGDRSFSQHTSWGVTCNLAA